MSILRRGGDLASIPSDITYPHCDPRVLHPPGACKYCDESGLQAIREAWGIAFTGQDPPPNGLPCPADHARPTGGRYDVGPHDHRAWPGNRAAPKED